MNTMNQWIIFRKSIPTQYRFGKMKMGKRKDELLGRSYIIQETQAHYRNFFKKKNQGLFEFAV